MSDRTRALLARWLGVGLAVVVSVVTLGLGFTGQLSLYISPESGWFACAGAVVTLIVAIWSCTVPLGAESDHGHSHGGADDHDHEHGGGVRRMLAVSGSAAAAVVATGVVVTALVLPPASLSVELAMSRAGSSGALFAGADTPTLGVADTSTFGVGEWSTVFSTATRPEAYDGTSVTLSGFVTPGSDGESIALSRLIITHCVIDAQPASVPVAAAGSDFAVGEWVSVTGTVTATDDGKLSIVPTKVEQIAEPGDPYEY